METLFLVSIFGFLIFVSSVDKEVFVEANENSDNYLHLKSVVKKLKELEQIVQVQDIRITELEKRPTTSNWKSIVELQETVQRQNDRIVKLETRVSRLEAMVTNQEIETIHIDTSGDVSKINQTTVLRKKNFIRKGTFSIFCVCVWCVIILISVF